LRGPISERSGGPRGKTAFPPANFAIGMQGRDATERRRLIGFSGFAGVGKDTAANAVQMALLEKMGRLSDRRAFADAVRAACYALDCPFPTRGPEGTRRPFSVRGEATTYRTLLETHGYESAKRSFPSVREFVVAVGEAVRECVGASAWIDVLLPGDSYVWPDMWLDRNLEITFCPRTSEESEVLERCGGADAVREVFARCVRNFCRKVNRWFSKHELSYLDIVESLGDDEAERTYAEVAEFVASAGRVVWEHAGKTSWIGKVLEAHPEVAVPLPRPRGGAPWCLPGDRRPGTEDDELDVLILSDVRTSDEADRIRALGGCVWGITRPGFDPVDGMESTHSVRLVADLVIRNDGGVAELSVKVRECLLSLFGEEPLGIVAGVEGS
jgi:hypothetical protein